MHDGLKTCRLANARTGETPTIRLLPHAAVPRSVGHRAEVAAGIHLKPVARLGSQCRWSTKMNIKLPRLIRYHG